MTFIKRFRNLILLSSFLTILLSCGERRGYNCASCHIKLHPGLVKDFNSSKMSSHFGCEKCHGIRHRSEDDVSNAFLPVTSTCGECHKDQEEQYLKGKHAIAYNAIKDLSFTHNQPDALIKGRKGCGGCHSASFNKVQDRFDTSKPKYGMGCINCHTRHKFSKSEALEPESCKTCHMGFDHAQYEMWSGSKHGTIYLSDRAKGSFSSRAPKCQTCHMSGGNHNVITSWGFFAVRGFEDNKGWEKDRKKIFQAMGILDRKGQKTDLYYKSLELKVFRENRKEFNTIRNSMVDRCLKCHSGSFVKNSFSNAEKIIEESDRIFADAVRITENKRGKIPDLFQFYEVEDSYHGILFEMFMDHRMKAFQAGFHINPDYSTWYGYGKLKKKSRLLKDYIKKKK